MGLGTRQRTPNAHPTRRSVFASGLADVAPILVGVVPFGLVAGIAPVEAGFSALQTVAMSSIVFAGAAQLAMADLVGKGAPAWVVAVTALVVNLRMMMYSAALAPHFRSLGARWKALLAYLLTDQAFAVSIVHFAGPVPRPHKHWYYLGGAVGLWGIWQVSTLAGVVLGAGVPEGWHLDFAVPLMFLALLAKALKDRVTISAAVAGGAVAVLASGLPHHLGLIAGALAGVVLGGIVDRRRCPGRGQAPEQEAPCSTP